MEYLMNINSEAPAPMTDTHERMMECVLAVIQYTLKDDEGLAFLRCWNEGDFRAIREEWPDAPEEVFWADPLYKRKD